MRKGRRRIILLGFAIIHKVGRRHIVCQCKREIKFKKLPLQPRQEGEHKSLLFEYIKYYEWKMHHNYCLLLVRDIRCPWVSAFLLSPLIALFAFKLIMCGHWCVCVTYTFDAVSINDLIIELYLDSAYHEETGYVALGQDVQGTPSD